MRKVGEKKAPSDFRSVCRRLETERGGDVDHRVPYTGVGGGLRNVLYINIPTFHFLGTSGKRSTTHGQDRTPGICESEENMHHLLLARPSRHNKPIALEHTHHPPQVLVNHVSQQRLVDFDWHHPLPDWSSNS
jgi:hypothetical protein